MCRVPHQAFVVWLYSVGAGLRLLSLLPLPPQAWDPSCRAVPVAHVVPEIVPWALYKVWLFLVSIDEYYHNQMYTVGEDLLVVITQYVDNTVLFFSGLWFVSVTVCVFIRMWLHVCTFMWRPEVNLGSHSSGASTRSFSFKTCLSVCLVNAYGCFVWVYVCTPHWCLVPGSGYPETGGEHVCESPHESNPSPLEDCQYS